jgi:hypothetical protein
VCWGVILGEIVETESRPSTPDDPCHPDCSQFVEYELRDVNAPIVDRIDLREALLQSESLIDSMALVCIDRFDSINDSRRKYITAALNAAADAAPPADARDGGRILLLQAIDAMSKLRQSLEFPGKHGGLYVFPEHAVRKFTDEQARLMYEEKRLAGVAQECVTDSARLEFVMQKFPGSAARDAGITWSANTIDDYRAAIDRAMGGE